LELGVKIGDGKENQEFFGTYFFGLEHGLNGMNRLGRIFLWGVKAL